MRATARLVGLLFLAALVLTGACRQSDPAGNMPDSSSFADPTARVLVTSDFGQELLLDVVVDLDEATSAMDALELVAEVQTAYGGGFVNSINGLKSDYTGTRSGKSDWFWYINGMQSKGGAFDYTLQPGDVEHWDFHSWEWHYGIPAIIGHFPEPFLHGFGGKVAPTLIVYDSGFEQEAESLRAYLSALGVEEVYVKTPSELGSDKAECNIVILAAADSELIEELNSDRLWKRAGFFARFQGGKIVAYDSLGEVSEEYGAGCGLIQATQNPWNPGGIGACENVVWMVSGVDDAGVRAAAGALAEQYPGFWRAYGAVVTEDEIITLPR